ncbi:MAG: hypothetical protein KDD47_04020, partial [Acidobacteria bacterium]|nr:hypothetical protein [Acidobacteriota bacterium]
SGLGFSKHFQRRNAALMALREGEDGLEASVRGWLEDPYLTSKSSTAAREKLPELLRTSGALTQVYGFERGRLAYGHLGEILAPTLVLVGEEDHPDIHAHAGAIQAGVRGARREIVPDSGHLLALERPEALLEVALPFLQEPVTVASGLDFRISPCLNFYFYLRSLAAAEEEAAGPPEIRAAVAAMRQIQEELGKGLLGWESFDEAARECTSVADLARRLGEVPDPVELFGGREVSLRERTLALGQALVAAENVYAAEIWPQQEPGIREAVERLRADLLPRLPEALAYHFRSLSLPDPKAELPVYFVHEIPWPGAVTQAVGGGAACFLGTSSLAPDMLLETVLHESTHGFLSLDRGGSTVTDTLRGRLREEAGLSFRDRRLRDIPHTLMFVQSGETVRRILDPQHVHYGEKETYYDRVPLAREELSIWVDHLDGKLSREQALDRLVGLAMPQEAAAP